MIFIMHLRHNNKREESTIIQNNQRPTLSKNHDPERNGQKINNKIVVINTHIIIGIYTFRIRYILSLLTKSTLSFQNFSCASAKSLSSSCVSKFENIFIPLLYQNLYHKSILSQVNILSITFLWYFLTESIKHSILTLYFIIQHTHGQESTPYQASYPIRKWLVSCLMTQNSCWTMRSWLKNDWFNYQYYPNSYWLSRRSTYS